MFLDKERVKTPARVSYECESHWAEDIAGGDNMGDEDESHDKDSHHG